MPERERGFNPEDPNLSHDMSQAFLDSTEDELWEYLSQFDPSAKLVLNISAADADPAFIKRLLLKYSATKVTINCDQADKETLQKMLPYSSVEFLVTE